MLLPALLVTDTHFTAKPDDLYRWGLFDWLREQCTKRKIRTLVFLGDLTDAKDYHSSTLVNLIVTNLVELSKHVEEIEILLGNHDYLKEGHAFFSFLNVLPKISFITEPTARQLRVDRACLYLPHTKNIKEWEKFDFSIYDYVFMHQTVQGSIASNGQTMDGELNSEFKQVPLIQIYSGDIHVPQDVGNVRYVGSPYHVHFGDKFKPRCIVINKDDSETEIHFETLSRVTLKVTGLGDFIDQVTKLKRGDQIKVVMVLSQSDKFEWDTLRKNVLHLCEAGGVTVHDFKMKVAPARKILTSSARSIRGQASASSTISKFAEVEDLGADVLDIGLEIIE